MKSLIIVLIMGLAFNIYAQTGPGGIGTTDGNSNLKIWLKADDIDADGDTQDNPSNGDAISTWVDNSGNSNDFTQTVSSECPTYKTGTFNAVYYDPSLAQEMNGTITGAYTDASAYFVIKPVEDETYNTLFNNSNYSLRVEQYSNTSKVGYTRYGSGDYKTNINSPFGTDAIISYHKAASSSSMDIRVNASTESLNIGSSSAGIPYDDLGKISSGSNRTAGDFYEVILFNQRLNSAQITILDNYLSAKYGGISIPADKYAGDDAGNGDYDFNVIGVGQESSTDYHTKSIDGKGLTIEQNSGFDDGDYLFAGNNGETNFATTGDVSSPIEARWRRAWYFDVTDPNTDMTVDITFDFSDAGISQTPGTAANYKLLYRSGTSGSWSAFSYTPTVSGDQVKFSNVSISFDGYYTIGTTDETNSTLPIELLSFSVNKNKETVNLNWQTATEINNNYFTVERSQDGQNWEAIAQIKGAGNSNKVLRYNSIDANPLEGVNYYRLKQTDFDGEYSYSSIRKVQIGRNAEIRIYPNPTQNTITIEGISAAGQDIHIYNMIGVDVGKEIPAPKSQGNNFVVDLSSLPVGVYFIQVEGQSFKVFKK